MFHFFSIIYFSKIIYIIKLMIGQKKKIEKYKKHKILCIIILSFVNNYFNWIYAGPASLKYKNKFTNLKIHIFSDEMSHQSHFRNLKIWQFMIRFLFSPYLQRFYSTGLDWTNNILSHIAFRKLILSVKICLNVLLLKTKMSLIKFKNIYNL